MKNALLCRHVEGFHDAHHDHHYDRHRRVVWIVRFD
jgi:hypothetical protein